MSSLEELPTGFAGQTFSDLILFRFINRGLQKKSFPGRLTNKLKPVKSQGRILRGGGPDRDRPKTAILGPQFCRILVLGPHFWWSGGGPGPRGPPWIRP